MSNDNSNPSDKVAAYEASAWQLMRRRFCKHKLAVWMACILTLIYILCLNADFFAPYEPNQMNTSAVNMPPQVLHFGAIEGRTLPWLYVHPFKSKKDPLTLVRKYQVDESKRIPIQFFTSGREWHFMGLIKTNLHFFGVEEGEDCYLMGTDKLGQDVYSRVLYGGRASLLVSVGGVSLSFFLGIILGGISGFYGGTLDMLIQRFAEILQSIPRFPLWLALGAAIPKEWTSLQAYLAMTVILASLTWTGLCRVVRGRILTFREENYAKAAILCGAKESRVIFKHLMPNFASHIIAAITLAVPMMILGETALSFLGLGIQAPDISWGVLLQDAQKVEVIHNQQWLLMPGLMVILTVISFNIVGDGLRDAADPYA